MIALPPPVLETHEGIVVVRDDLLPGGTKRRALVNILRPSLTYTYASPAYGHAQVALAYAAEDVGATVHIFVAERREPTPQTREARDHGAIIHRVSPGYLSVTQARARDFARWGGSHLLPFGLDTESMHEELVMVAADLPIDPFQVWTVLGSGTLSRALQAAWPGAVFYGVRVGAEPRPGVALVLDALERFDQDAQEPPPFPSASHYDAKAWRFIRAHALSGALFWNVAA